MKTEKIKIRLVSQDDEKRIWEIRNNPEVRNVSGDSRIIKLEQHHKWFAKRLKSNAENFLVVVDVSNKTIGYARIDKDVSTDLWRVSIAMEKSIRGRGVGTALLNKLKGINHGNKRDLLAEVRKENVGSIKFFESNGFTICEEDDKFVRLVYDEF